MMPPLVSVVIPAYKQESYIEETVRSALNQIFRDIEVVVVDDGSPDRTGEVVSLIKDDRLQYHRQTNSGRPACSRNAGIKMARGQYIAFLDGDDLWLPDKLEKQLLLFKDHPDAGLVYTNAIAFKAGADLGPIIKKSIRSGWVFNELFMRSSIAGCTVMAPRQILLNLGGFDESKELLAIEDYDLWLRISRKYPIYYINESLARYRLREGNTSGDDIKRYAREIGHIKYFNNRLPVAWTLRLAKHLKLSALYLIARLKTLKRKGSLS